MSLYKKNTGVKLIKIPNCKPSFIPESKEYMTKVVDSGWLTQGNVTAEFEDDLSRYLSSNVTTVNNGTSALIVALLAHDIKKGDKVIVPDYTFIATSSAVKLLGAEVLVLDLAGLSVDLDPIIELSKRYNFTLIDDAAQAFGAEYKNRKIGSFEHTTTFSFS